MQPLILLCLVAGAFAGCPANSHDDACGTACPLTCENYKNPPDACILLCVPGCHCDAGYVKNKNGHCVRPEQCKSRAHNEVCGKNEEFANCGTACPLTCDNFNNPPEICPLMCVIGCQCKRGYVKTSDGRCVLPENCPNNGRSIMGSASRGFDAKSCLEERDEGMCRGYFPMYHFDASTGKCKKFIYGGCQGNGNKFASEEECLEKCSTFSKKSDGRVMKAKSEVCDQPIKRGICLAFMHRYAYDKDAKECTKFVYGGCGGNGNNFKSLEECKSACIE